MMKPHDRSRCVVQPSVSPDDHIWDFIGLEKQKALNNQSFVLYLVPRKGIEPARISTPEPKSNAAAPQTVTIQLFMKNKLNFSGKFGKIYETSGQGNIPTWPRFLPGQNAGQWFPRQRNIRHTR